MALFLNKNNKLEFVEEIPFKLEKEIQSLCETNMSKLLGIDFVKSEFSIGGFRIDSLWCCLHRRGY